MSEEKCIRLEGVIEKNKHQHQREMALREQELQSHHRNELDSIGEYSYIHTRTYTHTCTHTCTHRCTHTYTHTYTHTCTHTYS